MPFRQPLAQGSRVIIDSALSVEDALRDNPDFPCPAEIRAAQHLITLEYWSFDCRIHVGQLVIHRDLVKDMEFIFRALLFARFPIAKMIPIVAYGWDDERSMQDNNTSGFNYRKKAHADELSLHAYGRAIDINPWLNPCIIDGVISPAGARYDPSAPGALTNFSLPTRLFKARGYQCGLDWITHKDYQHFEKPFPT